MSKILNPPIGRSSIESGKSTSATTVESKKRSFICYFSNIEKMSPSEYMEMLQKK